MTAGLETAHLSRRTLLGSTALLSALPALAGAQRVSTAAAAQSSPGDWALYGADLAGTRVADGTAITSANVGNLSQAWRIDVGGAVSGTPVIAGGTVYVGSYTGILHALDLSTGATV